MLDEYFSPYSTRGWQTRCCWTLHGWCFTIFDAITILYSMLSRYGFEGKDSGLAAIVTLASSLDYASSKSSLKLLLPLIDPAQALNVPIIPLRAMSTAAYLLTSRAPYVLSWLNHMISAQDVMHPDLFKKLTLNSFCKCIISFTFIN
ncbi:hypothetical protein Hdeb2414_s0008g00267751 [Helianthus debilis subsp. tardiflorus]